MKKLIAVTAVLALVSMAQADIVVEVDDLGPALLPDGVTPAGATRYLVRLVGTGGDVATAFEGALTGDDDLSLLHVTRDSDTGFNVVPYVDTPTLTKINATGFTPPANSFDIYSQEMKDADL